LDVIKFLRSVGAQVDKQSVLKACRSRSPNSLDLVRYLIEEAQCSMPNAEELDKIRPDIRLDVVQYLDEKGLMKKTKK